MSERLCNRFRNSRREAQARKQLEKEKHKTWFYNEKTRLHLAEVSFLVAKTAMCKRSLRLLEVVEQNSINFWFENITNECCNPKALQTVFWERSLHSPDGSTI